MRTERETISRRQKAMTGNALQVANGGAIVERQTIGKNTLAAFEAYLDASPATVRAYKGNLRQFFRYLAETGEERPTRETVISYREELKERCKATTVQNYIEAVKIFFAWTETEGLYPNVAERVKGAKISREHKRDYLTGEQIAEVLEAIDRSTEKGLRDYALVLLTVTGGLRTIEAHRANIGDFGKAGNATALYIQGKGREEKAEFVKIPREVETAVNAYLKARGVKDKNKAAKEPLFVSCSNNESTGQRLSVRSISGIIKSRFIAAGYDSDRLTAHSLRHSAVTISLLEGNTLQEAQQFARHRNIATTQIYAHNLDRAKNNCEYSIIGSIFNKK